MALPSLLGPDRWQVTCHLILDFEVQFTETRIERGFVVALKPFEYIVGDLKIKLLPANDVIAVRFREPALYSVREQAAMNAPVEPFETRFEVPGEKFTVFRVSDAHPAAAAADQLQTNPDVARTAPVFELKSKRVIATDRVLVKLKDTSPEHMSTLRQTGTGITGVSDKEFVLQLSEDQDPLEISIQLAKLDWIDYAEPDFVTIGKYPHTGMDAPGLQALSAADPDYAFKITECDKAWMIQRGDPAIRIAMLDDGVDLQHIDLAGAIVAAYDAVLDAPLSAPNQWDGHGTACAGLAAGTHTAPLGVRGMGCGCSLLAVRIASSPYANGPWVTSSSYIRRGIDWAVDHDAAVISNSWGGGAPSNAVADSFDRARSVGRSGRGCVLVVAAGNEGGPVEFPANVPGVLAVSGTNEFDEFKNPFSRDQETWWGSNYGPEVDVAAPAVHIRTTDITGSGGMSPGDYAQAFNGTSAATPLVAGLAGLVLSADSSLTEIGVREVICSTADKVGQYPYTNGRNDELGFGRINALRAVQVALGTPAQNETNLPPVEQTNQETGTGNELAGTVRAVGGGTPRAGAFYLDQDGKASYLLKTFTGDDQTALASLEQQSLATLSGFEGKLVRVRYAEMENTPYGSIIWGVQIELADSGDDQAIPPNEIRMGYVESGSSKATGSGDFGIPDNEVRLPFVDVFN